jgi:phosphatidylglycerol lysyltransferase
MGLTAYEVEPDTLTEDQWSRTQAEVRKVSDESLACKPQAGEMKFYEGRLGDHPLGRRRLFVARSDHGAGRIEGFVVCNPMRNETMWSAEIYRHRSDAVRGTIPFLFHRVMLQLQAEGVQGLSLSIIPGLHCQGRQTGESFLLRYGLLSIEKCFNFVFDIPGLRHFKSRFRPRYEDLYVCARPKLSTGSIWAILSEWGLLNLSLSKLTRIIGARLRKRSRRDTLAKV